ncbi:MAG: DUF3987 domain-containing protein [Inhella sp.]
MSATLELARLRDGVQALRVAPLPDRKEAIARARAVLAPSLKERQAPSYPLAALGPLADACATIAEVGQVRPAMVGQCLLGAASLLTQGLFNVETLAGPRPLSLYLLTLGDSGDGKSTAQGPALAPVNELQRRESDAYRLALAEHDAAKGGRKKGEDAPQPPAMPYRLCGDATVEGLRRDLDAGPVAQGVFTDEAAAILAGYGMSAEQRSKTAGVFSKLWDSGHLSVSRAAGGRVERYGRRVAMHWLIQPMAASETLGDPMLSALGFWPRFLAAWPDPQTPRLARPFRPDTLPAVGAYWGRCAELLALPLGDDAGHCPVLPLAPEARAMLGSAFEAFERDARAGPLRPIKPFALRASEQACRVAGVLAAFAGRDEVSESTMAGSLALTAYSLKTWQALIEDSAADPGAANALRLYEWLTNRPGWCEKLATIVKAGPAPVRSKDKRDAALDVLQAAGLVAVADGAALVLIAPEVAP